MGVPVAPAWLGDDTPPQEGCVGRDDLDGGGLGCSVSGPDFFQPWVLCSFLELPSA